ncbi:MAG: leucyl/phenylalanyl-tRNA--protein transferase [Rhodospirillales bacterium]|jgi:leucyl/phenylalanyl-tRNA--protein transferase|nr:leucyl/phenylalanyl-tRNA--protein transferase [Rhodospirillales bacterium]
MVIRAYSIGIFPMASHRHDPHVHWVAPNARGILPLHSFHLPRRLGKTIRRRPYVITCDRSFADVIAGCAAPRPLHPETWINAEITRVFVRLHDLGHAHSIEAWRGGRLVGGLYGMALGGAFFGESMFSRATDASKIVLVHLVALLRRGGFTLLDTQFITDHLRQFGAVEIPNPVYLQMLDDALQQPATFYSGLGEDELSAGALELATQSTTTTS